MYSYYEFPLNQIFDFKFNAFGMLSLIAAVINLILFYLLMKQKVKNLAHYYLALANLTNIVWAIFEGLTRLSNNPLAAGFWDTLSTFGWAFIPTLFLGFSLAFTGKEKILKNIYFQILIMFPAFLGIAAGLMTNLTNDRSPVLYMKEYYGWTAHIGPYFTYFGGPIIALMASYGYLELIRFRLTTKNNLKKIQSTFLIIAMTFPLTGALFTEIALPIFGFFSIPNLGAIMTAMACLVMSYAILKYKLFVINPATIVTNIADTMSEILIVFNAIDHKIEYINGAITKLLGFTKDQLDDQSISVLFGENYSEFHQKVIQPLEKGIDVSSIEVDLLSSSGKNIPFTFSASPYKASDGTVISIVGVATDIRQLKELLNVAAEQNKLKVTIESISDGVIALDLKGKVIMLNSSAASLLGIDKNSVIYQDLDNVVTLTDNNSETIHMDKLLPKNDVEEDMVILYKKELTLESKKKTATVNLTSSTIKEGKQVGLGCIITLQDLSKEKQLEEMKLDFVSMAAHELRTPLTSLRGYTYVLLRDYKDKLDEKANQMMNRINISTQRLIGLVENLLNVTKIERGTLTTHLEPIDWVGNIKEAIDEIKDQAEDKHINIIFEEPNEIYPAVYVDKLRINEVLTNLLSNAISYTPFSGSITVTLEKTQEYVTTHIKDTGEGIPAEALPHLFTKFFRVSGNLEMGSKGTGLGLYISKSIIEMHHGKIWAESEGLGKGSTFSISLPAKKLETVPEISNVSPLNGEFISDNQE